MIDVKWLITFLLVECFFCFANFVTTANGEFLLNGMRFRFLGTNCYYLHYSSDEVIDDLLISASQMNLEVLRIWGFLDGESYCRSKKTYMHPSIGVFGIPETVSGVKNGFERLDYIIQKAKTVDIKLIIVLVNNWDDFGGMNQYVNWFNEKHHDDFYTNEKIKQEYKKYIEYLLNRINVYTNIAYKDEPTIMAWELANEPRCETDKSGRTLLNWVREMSEFIKSIDQNHLVGVGDEGFFNSHSNFYPYKNFASWTYSGFSGVDWERLLSIESIDFATFHLYPTHWQVPNNEIEPWGLKWIEDHIKMAKSFSKPVILEEFGVPKTVENRSQIYELWLKKFYELGGDGAMFWMLAAKGEGRDKDLNGYFPDYDGFRVLNDDSLEAKIFRKIAQVIGRNAN